jgi:hypothetical protein
MLLTQLTQQAAVDPRREGLPTFALFGGDMNQKFFHKVVGSDMQVIGTPWGAIGNTTSSYTAGVMADPMFSYSASDFGTLNGNLSSEGFGFNAGWVQSLHQNDQYPAAYFGSTSASGMQGWNCFHDAASLKSHKGYTLINQVMPEGMRPRRFFGMIADAFVEYASLTQMSSNIDAVNLANYKGTRTLTVGNGTAGYNERTQTLVTIHSDNSTGNCVVTKFKSTVNLNLCKNLKEFFDNATRTEYTAAMEVWGGDNYSDKVVIVGDNDWIGVSYRNGNNHYYNAFDLTSAVQGSAAPFIYGTFIANTTSYGVSQGVHYYTKMQLTWDANWAAAFTPYYYYGCGASIFFASTKDPRRHFRAQNTNTSSGGMLTPIGRSKFALFLGINTDSASVSHITWDFAKTDTGNYSADTKYMHSGLAFNSVADQVIANGSLLYSSNAANSGVAGFFYSTCYPNFQTVNFWNREGAYTYEGAL